MRRIGITCIYIRFVDTFVVSFGQLPIATTKPCGKEVCLKDANTSKLWREATKPPCLPFLHSTCLFQTAFEFLYRDIEIRCRGARERNIYMYTYGFFSRKREQESSVVVELADTRYTE